jgi:hypothetical protein
MKNWDRSTLNETQRTLVLQHIEKDPSNCDSKDLYQENSTHLPSTKEGRRSVTQFRGRQLVQRKSPNRSTQILYVETCIEHGIPICERLQDSNLRAIEESLATITTTTTTMSTTPVKSEEHYNKMLDARRQQQSTPSSLFSSPASKDTRKPTSVRKMPVEKAGTAIICDKNQTEVEVDMMVQADTSNPWANLHGSLFSLIPNIKVGEKKSGKGVFAMSAFELLTICPDPRDAELRSCHLANGGYGWVMTYEVLPRSLMKDPESLTATLVDGVDDKGHAAKIYLPRCQSTETEYKAMFTRLHEEKIKTAKVLISTDQKCTLEYLNIPNDKGKLHMIAQLHKRTVKLDGAKLSMPVLTLAWRAALVDSITTVEKPKPTVEELTKTLGATWLHAPEREDDSDSE